MQREVIIGQLHKDVLRLMDFTEYSRKYIEELKKFISKNGFWNKLDSEIQGLIVSTVLYLEEIFKSFKNLNKLIKENRITENEIVVLNELGQRSQGYIEVYNKLPKVEEWIAENNANFAVLDEIYKNARNYFGISDDLFKMIVSLESLL